MRLYIVKEGDTLSSIADKYGLELAQLLAINPQITNPDEIMPGMKIKIATGPVAVSPGQSESGHPIHQTTSPQAETPFIQFSVPSVHAGNTGLQGGDTGLQAGTSGSGSMGSYIGQLSGSTNPSAPSGLQGAFPGGLSGMAEQSFTNLGMQGGNAGMQGGAAPSAGQVSQNQPYLSTIPYHFAGNPMYTGFGSFGENAGMQQSNAANAGMMPLSSNASNAGMAPLSSNAANPNMVPPLQQLGTHQTGFPASVSANIYAPYSEHAFKPYASFVNPLGTGGWPEAYTWSAPFEQMAANPNTSAAGMAYPVSAKKPCGCGGSTVGHYSLAEKQRAEGRPSAGIDSEGGPIEYAGTASESAATNFADIAPESAYGDGAQLSALEERAANLEQALSTSIASDRQSKDDKFSASIKQSTDERRSKSKKRRRTEGRKKRIRAQVHASHAQRQTEGHDRLGNTHVPWLNV